MCNISFFFFFHQLSIASIYNWKHFTLFWWFYHFQKIHGYNKMLKKLNGNFQQIPQNICGFVSLKNFGLKDTSWHRDPNLVVTSLCIQVKKIYLKKKQKRFCKCGWKSLSFQVLAMFLLFKYWASCLAVYDNFFSLPLLTVLNGFGLKWKHFKFKINKRCNKIPRVGAIAWGICHREV